MPLSAAGYWRAPPTAHPLPPRRELTLRDWFILECRRRGDTYEELGMVLGFSSVRVRQLALRARISLSDAFACYK